MRERHWRPAEVIEGLLAAGLQVVRFQEYAATFWDQFPNWPPSLRTRLPNSYAILAKLG